MRVTNYCCDNDKCNYHWEESDSPYEIIRLDFCNGSCEREYFMKKYFGIDEENHNAMMTILNSLKKEEVGTLTYLARKGKTFQLIEIIDKWLKSFS